MAPNTQNSTKSASAITTAEAELQPGERLIWADRAGASAVALQAVVPEAPGGIYLLIVPAIAIWQVVVHWPLRLGPLIFCSLFILLFLSLGLFFLSAPLRAAAQARRTIYAITDQRVFIISDVRRRSVTSYGPNSIFLLQVTERADGSGDIVFRRDRLLERVYVNASGDQTDDSGIPSIHQRGAMIKIGFFGIPEVRKVEEAMRRLVSEGSQVAQ